MPEAGQSTSALIGRLLQLIGMILLPIGLMYGLFGGEIRTEVKLLFIGGFIYLAGWILARKTD